MGSIKEKAKQIDFNTIHYFTHEGGHRLKRIHPWMIVEIISRQTDNQDLIKESYSQIERAFKKLGFTDQEEYSKKKRIRLPG